MRTNYFFFLVDSLLFFFLLTSPVELWDRSVIKSTVELYIFIFNHVCLANSKIKVS